MPRRRRPPRPPHALTTHSPRRLILQILLLQSLYYTTITLLLLFTSLITGHPHPFLQPLHTLLDWRSIRGDTAAGWTIGVLVWLVGGSVAGAVMLGVVVGRSKMVPDFVVTLHVLHGAMVWAWTGEVPRSTLWWAVQAGSVGVMGAGGVWACRWRELRPLRFGGEGGKEEEGGRGGGYEMVVGQGQGQGQQQQQQQVEDGRGREGRG